MNEPEQIVQQLSALAQGARLAIFRRLVVAGPAGLCPSDLQAELAVTPSVLSFHLKELKTARLITVRPDGRHLYYSADFTAMNALVAYLTENCCADSTADACCAPLPCATS
jgi:ArsR family transcriptional regulator, arsenate/arsenite/antimonite-responsive transcriptional repressor